MRVRSSNRRDIHRPSLERGGIACIAGSSSAVAKWPVASIMRFWAPSPSKAISSLVCIPEKVCSALSRDIERELALLLAYQQRADRRRSRRTIEAAGAGA